MKKIIKYIIFLLVGILLVGCGNTSSTDTVESSSDNSTQETAENEETNSSENLTPIKIGYNPGMGNITSFIAQDRGFDKDNGVEIELIEFSNSTDGLNALQTNKIDVGASFGVAAPLNLISQSANFTIFGGFLSGGMPIYAPQEFEYENLDSFVGKKVAYPRMYTPAVVWLQAMHDAGYDVEEDVELMEFKKPSEVLEAVKSGNADVGIGTNSTYLPAIESGLKVVAWSNDLQDPVHVCCRIVGDKDAVSENPEAYKGLLKSFLQAEKVLKEEPEYAVEVNSEYLGLDLEEAETLLFETNAIFEPDPKANQTLQFWDGLVGLGWIDPSGVNPADHIHIDLYQQAVEELIEEEPENAEYYQDIMDRFEEYNSEML